MPPSSMLVPMNKAIDDGKDLAPKAEDIARNPSALVAFLKKHPDRMNVDGMTPALVLTMSELLLDGQAWLVSEKLLHQATNKWTDRSDIKRAHARVLIQLGRPDYAVRIIDGIIGEQNAETQFLKALGLVRSQPKTQEKTEAALQAFRMVVQLRPDYRDVSGWTARDVQKQIDRMMGVPNPRSPHP